MHPMRRFIYLLDVNTSSEPAWWQGELCGIAQKHRRKLKGPSQIHHCIFLYPNPLSNTLRKKKNLFFSGEEGGQFLDSSMVIVCSVFHGDSYSRLVRNKPKIQRNIFLQVKIMFTNIISHSSLWCQVLSFSIINVRIQAGVDPLGRRLKRHRYLKSPFLITQECPEAVRGLAR